MLKIVIWGILCAVTVAVESLISKWLNVRHGVQGDIVGIFYMLFEGILGTVCLIVLTLQGEGLHSLAAETIWMLMLAAVCAFSGIVIAYFAMSIGIAGVVLSLYNANVSVTVILSQIFLHQQITKPQILGVVICMLAAMSVSLDDQIRSLLPGNKSSH